jgi:HK97 family phage major capsid protein
VNTAYRASGNAGWLMRDATAGIIRKIRSDAGGTIGPAMWVPSVTQGIAGGAPDTLLGFPAYTDPSVASCASNARIMGFGDFSAYYVRMTPVLFERSDDFAFSSDLVTFRCKVRADADLIDASAWNVLKQSVT